MTAQLRILSDSHRRPRLFVWSGPIDEYALRVWLTKLGWVIPEDLFQLWSSTGGGDLFETETVLVPMSDSDCEGAEEFNAAQYLAGMPHDYIVFHIGLGGMSAVRISDHSYVQLSPGNFRETSQFTSLDDWYSGLLLREYGHRYGLDLPARLDDSGDSDDPGR